MIMNKTWLLIAGLALMALMPLVESPIEEQLIEQSSTYGGCTFTIFHFSNIKPSLVVAFGGGYDRPNVTISTPEEKILQFCRDMAKSFDVALVSDFIFPDSKGTLDDFFARELTLYEHVHLFGISAGAVVVMYYAQESTNISSGIVCSAPADYSPLTGPKPQHYWHLAETANMTKIPLMFVIPSLDENFAEQMLKYYERDPVEKCIVYWNTTHNPLDWEPYQLSMVSLWWFISH